MDAELFHRWGELFHRWVLNFSIGGVNFSIGGVWKSAAHALLHLHCCTCIAASVLLKILLAMRARTTILTASQACLVWLLTKEGEGNVLV
ncbi:MAG: hypothetical protein ACR2IJ_05135 [Fluviibacter sp.]